MPINRLKTAAVPFAVAAIVVASDLTSKWWARSDLAKAPQHLVGPLWLRLSYNRGFSFSLSNSMPTVAAVLALLALGVVIGSAFFARGGVPALGFGLLVGGGVGNLVDRLTSTPARVTDFIAMGSFPTFNVADAAVTCGVGALIVAALLGRKLFVHK